MNAGFRIIITAAFSAAVLGVLNITALGAGEAGDVPWLRDLLPTEEVLDEWTEGAGYGAQKVIFQKVKVEDRATGRGRVLTYDRSGRALSEADVQALRAGTFQSLIHPDLVARFAKASAPEGQEPMEQVIVWFRVPKARENAVRALWDRTQEPKEVAPQATSDDNPAVAADRLAAVKAAEANSAAARARIAAGYLAEAREFIQRAGIPAERIIHRYNYAPAVSASLTLTECRRIEASGAVNFIFPNRTLTDELDVIVPSMRGYAGQQGRYNGSGVTIGHIEGRGPIVTNNPYLVVAGTYKSGLAPYYHASAIGGIIRCTHGTYRGMSRGCDLLSVNPTGDVYTGSSSVDVDPAVDWALAQGASILNWSQKTNDSDDGALDWGDIYMDYVVHNARVFFTKSAGNEGNDTGVVTSPGRGYNSLTVGNVQDHGTLSWADDDMRSSSSYVDPDTGGEKPEIAAYGSDVTTTATAAPWIADEGSGTSYAAPICAAIGGLIIDRLSSYADEPWALKAWLLASALAHNIEGTARLSEYDGAGKAVATATKLGGSVETVTEASFDAAEEYEALQFVMTGGETNRITMSYTHEPTSQNATPDPSSYDKCDLDLRLYVGGVLVASSSYGSANAFEIIDYKPASNVTASVRIRNYSWDPDVASIRLGVAYSHSSQMGSGADPIEDNYEQNDTRPAAADPRGNGGEWENKWLQDIDGLGVLADGDWYKINVTPNYNLVNIDCRFFDADGDVNIALYNAGGSLEGFSAGSSDDEYLSLPVVATGGVHYIYVYGPSYNTNRYDLWWDDVQPGPPSPPATVTVSPGLGCGVANLSWSPVDGVIGYNIYYDEDSSGGFVPSDNGTPANGSFVGNVTSVVILALAPTTTYYFAVVATNAGGTSVWSSVVSSRTGACEDNYEENDSRATAADPRHNGGNWELLWLSGISNRGVQYDSDYYTIAITPGFERIVVTCSFVHAEGDVDIHLVNTSGTFIASSTGTGNGESFDYTVGGGTNYYILVSGDGRGNVYDLRWDDAARIVPLPPSTISGSIGPGCGTVSLTWSAATGATGYKVYYDEDAGNPPFLPTDNGTPVSGSDVGNVTSKVITNLNPATYYYFAVRAYDADGDSDYSRQARVRSGACEDAYEENDSSATAAYPGGSDWRNTWISDIAGKGVQFDMDYFRLDVTSGYERVLARCTFEHDEGDLWLEMYNSNGTKVAQSGSTTDVEQIDHIVSAPGRYVLRVSSVANAGNVYDLWWNDAPRISPPSSVTANTGTNCGEVVVSWPRASNATSYVISYDEDSSNPPYVPGVSGSPASGTALGNVTNAVITGLNGGQSYYFAVQSRDAIGDSPYSEESLAVAGICIPVLLDIVRDEGTGQLTLRWFSDHGEVYDIQRSGGGISNFQPFATGIGATPRTNAYPISAGPSNTMFYRVQMQ